jgi:hypothetical protein
VRGAKYRGVKTDWRAAALGAHENGTSRGFLHAAMLACPRSCCNTTGSSF